MTETAVPRLYDVATDTFITDRAEIIDQVVTRFANLATWSERRRAMESLSLTVSDLAVSFLREVLADKNLQFGAQFAVHDLWRGVVSK